LENSCKKYKEAGARLFTVVPYGNATDSGLKLKQERFKLDRRRNSSTMRTIKHWKRLPKEVTQAPSLDVFKI